MATIKSYTDLEQSKKLKDILPTESADMYYEKGIGDNYRINFGNYADISISKNLLHIDAAPCWSLAALLGVLPAECECMALEHINYGNNHKEYFMHYFGGENTENYDNPIDACVAMIIKLHELKML